MQVAILAGGLATRLEDLTRNQPKSMVGVCGKPFLEYQIEMLRKEGVGEVILCVGYRGEQIESYFGNGERFGVNIRYSREYKLMGTAGALKNARELLDEVFFTLYGDSYLFLNFHNIMQYFESRDKLALMTVYKNYNKYGRSNTAVEGEMVSKFSKTERSQDMVYIEYGANIFRKDVLDLIPGDKFYSLEELFPILIEKEELLAFKVTERFYEIGSISGLKEFEGFARSRLN